MIKSRMIAITTDCHEDDTVQIEYPNVQSYNTPAWFLSTITLLTVVIDSKQSRPMNPDPTDDMTVTTDEDRQFEQDIKVPCATTEHTMNTDLNKIRQDTTDCPRLAC